MQISLGKAPTLKDFHADLLRQTEPEAQEIALAIEPFTNGNLNTFAKETNVDVDSRLICYDILDLGKQLQSIGMLVVQDNIFNRITANHAKGRDTYIFIDEIYLLFQHEYSANFLFTLMTSDILWNVFTRITNTPCSASRWLYSKIHSCASLLLANGVSEWIEHSDFGTTANIYAHLTFDSKPSSADALNVGTAFGRLANSAAN